MLYANPTVYVDLDGYLPVSPTDLASFAADVGKLLVEEIVYTAAKINGNEGVANLALEGMKEARVDAAVSTIGLINPVPGTSGAYKAVKVAEKAEDAFKAAEKAKDAARISEKAQDASRLEKAAEKNTKPKIGEESSRGTETVQKEIKSQKEINPELQKRADAYKDYKRSKGLDAEEKATKDQYENFRRGNAGENGKQLYEKKDGGYSEWNAGDGKKLHGNSLDAEGPHDVYVVRNRETGEVLRFGETGRDVETRLTEHVRNFKNEHEYTEPVRIETLKTVDGKQAAKDLENRYIETYKKLYGDRPPFNFNDH